MKIVKPKLLKVNDVGCRIGEDHQNAKLTNDQVEQIRQLHEEGMVGYRSLAKHFNVSRSTIGMICRYERHADTIAGYKIDGKKNHGARTGRNKR